MDLKKLMGWTVAVTLVLGVPALTVVLDGKTASGSSGVGAFETRTGMGGDTSGSGSSSLENKGGAVLAKAETGRGKAFETRTGMGGDTSGGGSSSLENKGGKVLADAASGGSSDSSVSPEAQGMNPTGTGASGTSPDSTSQTGRGDSSGEGQSGGTRQMTPDTMKGGDTGAGGMQNRTGMMPTPHPEGSRGY